MANIEKSLNPGMAQPNPPSSSDNWIDEQHQWKEYYLTHLSQQLSWFTNHIHDLKGDLSSLKKHLGSLLALLRQSHIHSSTHAEAVELISSLHPWPLRWEVGDAWEYEIRFAIQYFETLNKQNKLLEFQIYLADYLQSSGKAGGVAPNQQKKRLNSPNPFTIT